uniref:Cnd1 domain-containing protein n=1 Tax=Angiostrongylus cantonensis TaxID=6313 RepID=A0A0K0D0U9_ANGCA
LEFYSISLLLELTKTAKFNIQPFLGELIPALLDAISDTEPEILNYVAARSSLAELEVLDDARAQIARTSPVMSAIHDLIPQIDGSVLVVLQPRLCEQLRSSVGSSTRSSCAQFLVLLALRQPQLLGDYPAQCGKVMEVVEKYRLFLYYFIIDKIFTALMSGIHDRNPSVRKNFASAISYMAKYATSVSMGRLMSAVLKSLIGEDESMKLSAKQILKSLSTNSTELLQNYSKLIIPYIFLETCQSDSLAATLLSNLMPMMSGRIWTGKEHLISAISVLFLSLTKEASKAKKQYAAAGLLACAVFARSLSHSKAADWLFEKVDENMRKVTRYR